MFPSTSLLTASQALYSDHTVRSGALVPTTSGTGAPERTVWSEYNAWLAVSNDVLGKMLASNAPP